MSCHYAIREEGKLVASVGIYPYTVYIGDRKFTFATVGNMGVDPSATAEIPKDKAAFAAANFPLYLYTSPFDKV